MFPYLYDRHINMPQARPALRVAAQTLCSNRLCCHACCSSCAQTIRRRTPTGQTGEASSFRTQLHMSRSLMTWADALTLTERSFWSNRQAPAAGCHQRFGDRRLDAGACNRSIQPRWYAHSTSSLFTDPLPLPQYIMVLTVFARRYGSQPGCMFLWRDQPCQPKWAAGIPMLVNAIHAECKEIGWNKTHMISCAGSCCVRHESQLRRFVRQVRLPCVCRLNVLCWTARMFVLNTTSNRDIVVGATRSAAATPTSRCSMHVTLYVCCLLQAPTKCTSYNLLRLHIFKLPCHRMHLVIS